MANIKKLKLKLKSGLLSELQSDSIFGHFAWRLKEQFGDEILNEFLKNFVDNKPIFTISDGMFERNNEVFFPKPLKLLPEEFTANYKKERIKNFLVQKETKSQKFITSKQLNLYLNGNLVELKKSLINEKIETPSFESDLRTHVEIDRIKFTSKDGQLYTENPKYLKDDTSLSLLVKIIDSDKFNEYKCNSILKSVFEIGYGKNKSSGYGQFEVIEFEDYDKLNEPSEPNGFITLSQYLPANLDAIQDPYYDINVKYGKLGEEFSSSKNPFKPAMLLMKPGSCFMTNKKQDFYGRAVNNFIDYKPNVVHNGIAFTLNAIL